MALNTNQTTDSIVPTSTNFLVGSQARADTTGQYTFSHSGFTAAGDLMVGQIPMYVVTNLSTTPTEMRVGNGSLSLSPEGVIGTTNYSNYVFNCNIVARNVTTPVATDIAAWTLQFVIQRNFGEATTTINGLTKTVVYKSGDVTEWDVTADVGSNRPRIMVTGQGSKNIRWVANVNFVKAGG